MMKKIFGLLSLIILMSACEKISNRSDLDDSQDIWRRFKNKHDNSYSYTVTHVSWIGYSDSTRISVKDGRIIGRTFKSYMMDGNTGIKTLLDSWHEDHNTLGNHNISAELLTMDEVYDKASKVWLKADPRKNNIYLEFENGGIISTCGYVPIGCQDDCFTGIRITEVRPLAAVRK